ncbi:hypothetical protein F7Q99_29675 [Streptomyces kaniharaensis]|uniref:HAF repeat-containing protein n=1 Tax=Streptomyces kaniharaensis TaxID=212423 RepID=A0A6N7L382_9ACTN|nr:hypothetical protein [Streptomyces kaniharaensis]MQS16273.1 hypothetical protein [Streptomyces kaniharaensis]
MSWAPDGTATALAPLPGNTNSQATAVSSTGVVIGSSWADTAHEHAVAWDPDGTAVALEPLGDDVRTVVAGINSSGVAVGYSQGDDILGPRHAVVWSPDGTPTALNATGWADSLAVRINDAGVVIGFGGPNPAALHSLIWRADGSVTDLGYSVRVAAVNSSGTVAGTSAASLDTLGYAMKWTPDGTATALGPKTSGSDFSDATAINDSGTVVGYSWYADPAREFQTALRWNPDGTTTVLCQPDAASARFINNPGLVVGVSLVHGLHGYARHFAAVWK